MLELVGVTAGYGPHIVLRDVNLIIPDGTVVALLGPNGAGKTTLLRVTSGLIAPAAGRVILDGRDITGSRPQRFANLGICHIPEGRGIYPTLTVAENLRLQTPPHRDRHGAGNATVEFPRLGQRLSQRAGTLSGGEQQMLAMSRAYLSESNILLVDEVSMGLAPIIVNEIFAHLRRLAARGVAMLVVEQYVHQALDLADLVYILEHGQVRFAGEPGELADGALLASYLGGAIG